MTTSSPVTAVPRGALIGAAVLMVATVAMAAGSRRAHLAEAPAVSLPAQVAVDLRFEDRPDGTLAAVDVGSGRDVSDVPPESNGFVRGVLRGMFRSRKLESLGHQGAFHLAREADGRLTISDPETHREVNLDSFGPTNAAAFARILEDGARFKADAGAP